MPPTTNAHGVDADAVKASIASTLDPLKRHLETIEAAITEKEGELSELRDLRRMVQRTITAADPDAPKPGPKPTPKQPRDKNRIAAETLDKAVATLADRAALYPDGFTTTIAAGLLGVHKTTSNRILKALQREGRVRLDHTGGHRGMERFYKLTSQPEG